MKQMAILVTMVLLRAICSWFTFARTGCKLPHLELQSYGVEGDVMFGGLIPVFLETLPAAFSFREPPAARNCNRLYTEMYQCVLAMAFATEEINQNPLLLPNLTLGFHVVDSCYTESAALKGTLWLLSGQRNTQPNYRCQGTHKMPIILGDLFSISSVEVAQLLGRLNIPQISYGSGLPLLSDKKLYPTFVRTAPSTEMAPYHIVQLVLHFGWTWVGLLGSYTDYGQQGIRGLLKAFSQTNVCIAFLETLRPDSSITRIQRTIQVIKESTATVMIMFASAPEVIPLMEVMAAQGIYGKIWIVSPALLGSPLFLRRDLWDLLNGTLGIPLHSRDIPLFKEFQYQLQPSTSPRDIFIRPFWEHVFRCKWADEPTQVNSTNNGTIGGKGTCTGREQIETLQSSVYDTGNLRLSYTTYNAVYVFAHAIHKLLACDAEIGACSGLHNIQYWQLLHFVKNVHFRNTVGEYVYFDANGDTAHPNDIVHWQMENDGSSRYVTFGTYDSRLSEDQRLTINDDKVWWGRSYSQVPISVCSKGCPLGYREVAQEGKPVCCFDCLQCPQGEIANTTGLRSCVKCPEDHWSNRERVKCIKKNLEFLCFDETLGIVLAAIAVVLALITILVLLTFIRYRETPIVRANNRALSYVLLISLVLCFLCPLIFIGRPEKRTCVLRQVVFGVIFSLCVSCILAKTTVVVLAFKAREPNSKYRSWLAVRIPSLIILVCLFTQVTLCVIWLLSSPPYLELNMKDSVEKIILQCNENSETAFYCMLGFLSLLACLSFLVAFQARKLPDRFNETKWITFSMMAFLSVWALFIPAYLSTKGKYMVAVEVFAILSSSAAVLVCIFFPKCYIVLLKSDMHTREKLTRINEKCN